MKYSRFIAIVFFCSVSVVNGITLNAFYFGNSLFCQISDFGAHNESWAHDGLKSWLMQSIKYSI